MKERVVIIGSGGHAKVIIELFVDQGDFKIEGCVAAGEQSGSLLGFPILGDDSVLPGLFQDGVRYAFVAIGDNRLRSRISEKLTQMGFTLASVVSPAAHVSKSATIGCGVAIMAGVIINASASIGDNSIINTGATIDHDCVIGANCHIAPGTNLAGNVSIGTGSFLGIGCRAIPKIKVGEWTVLGAGSTITCDIPDHVLALGVPARILKPLSTGE